MKNPKIFIIGMPGSGKTTHARKIAEKLNIPFIDLDDKIEKESELSIPEIFEKKGEDYFRELERKIFLENIKSQKFIMATGGGTPCFFDNMDMMKKVGLTIFLDVPIEDLASRLEKSHIRPLLKTDSDMISELTTLREKRIKYYKKANIQIQDLVDLKWIPDIISRL